MYTLAKDLGYETNELLWYFIIASTQAYAERKSGNENYDELRNKELTPEVLRLSKSMPVVERDIDAMDEDGLKPDPS